MYKKIKNIEITPAQLALDPCSGSVIITDPDTGEVRAMVSYPSYVIICLANGIDSEYYASLNTDLSSPIVNRATAVKGQRLVQHLNQSHLRQFLRKA